MGRLVACAGAVVRRDDGRILVVQRGQPPSQGMWSIPGGRVEPGETREAAGRREVLEETGLTVEIGMLLGQVTLPGGHDDYDVIDFSAVVVGDPDSARPGDDAVDVRWVTRDELAALPSSPGLADQLDAWSVWD